MQAILLRLELRAGREKLTLVPPGRKFILRPYVKPHFRVCPILLCLLGAPALPAQTPELSADEPIAFSTEEGLLVATGNAVFVDENTTVEADEIRYQRNLDQVEAIGNVRVTRQGLRLLARHVTYDARTKAFSASDFRAGYPPLFVEGEHLNGNLDQIDFSQVSLYFREPVARSPKLSIRQGTWVADEYLRADGLRLHTVGSLGLPLPGLTYAFEQPSVEVNASLGYRNSLGAYAQSFWLYPFSQRLAAGGNFDLYSARGILIGPAFRFTDWDGRFTAFVNSGWIHDHDSDERGLDLLGQRIGQSRGFIDFGLGMRNEGSLQFQVRGTRLSDSEVLRDFRPDFYDDRFQPDNFLEFTWQDNDLLLTVFARSQLNDAYEMVERLPEVRAEWLPQELGSTGFFLQASATATRYRLQSARAPVIGFPPSPFAYDVPFIPLPVATDRLIASEMFNRLDGSATLTRSIHGPAGTSAVLRAGGRWTRFEAEGAGLLDERFMGELGLDLSQTLGRTWRVDWERFRIERLRHETRWSLAYRWYPWDEDDLDSPGFDQYRYHAAPPLLDLADTWNLDDLSSLSVARFGWEHRLLVAGPDEPYRDFLRLNLYQDLLFSAEPGADEWEALYAQAELSPAPWLRLAVMQKFRPEDLELEALFLRTTLRSADLWSLTFQAEYLEQAIEQYELEARYRFSEDFGLLASWTYDARLHAWTFQRYGITRRFGNVWQLELYVTFTDQNAREDNFSVGARLNWLAF